MKRPDGAGGGHPADVPGGPGSGAGADAATGDQPHAVFHRQYAGGEAPWDIDKPQPEIVALEDAGVFGPRVLDVGCGTGETALFLASRDHDVTGIDAVSAAVDTAKARAARRGLDVCFRTADVLDALPELIGKFHSVTDVGFFHALSDEQRADFAAKLAEKLAPGGVYTMLCFSDRVPGTWGPRRVSEAEIRAVFAGPEWVVREIRPAELHSAVDAMPIVDANLALIERA
ncbi:MAG: class I SAM-dependent methyltransferase [Coriobacteriia bacterium]|nr:class I SAM-dependent methyltransferase [Coriobacteriia bacterium]